MKTIALYISILFFVTARANKDSSRYLVTTKGDTVHLHKKAYVQYENHPQRICNWNEMGKKYFISADSIKTLRMQASEVGFAYVKGLNSYPPFSIVTKKGTCSHFGHELFRQDATAIYTTPHCSRCSSFILYFKTSDGLGHAITKHNFREVINKHFNGSASLVEFSKRKRFSVYALMKMMQ